MASCPCSTPHSSAFPLILWAIHWPYNTFLFPLINLSWSPLCKHLEMISTFPFCVEVTFSMKIKRWGRGLPPNQLPLSQVASSNPEESIIVTLVVIISLLFFIVLPPMYICPPQNVVSFSLILNFRWIILYTFFCALLHSILCLWDSSKLSSRAPICSFAWL